MSGCSYMRCVYLFFLNEIRFIINTKQFIWTSKKVIVQYDWSTVGHHKESDKRIYRDRIYLAKINLLFKKGSPVCLCFCAWKLSMKNNNINNKKVDIVAT